MKKLYALLMAFVFSCTIAKAELTGDIVRVHDPCVIKQGSYYYLFSTGEGIPIRRSRDLKHWKVIGRVFYQAPEWTNKEVPGFDGHLWAPDIQFLNGKYYLYYSVSTFGSNRSCIGLVINRTLNPEDQHYRWIDQGVVIRSVPEKDNWNAIDAHLVVDESETTWLAFGSFWSGIKLVELDSLSGKPRHQPLKLIPIATRPHHIAIEAPFIVRRQGFYYLFVSFDQCCRGEDSTYKLMVGRSKRITGPYEDRTGQSLLQGGGTLLLSGHGNCRGPGHNAVLREGDTDWLVHHMYDASNAGIPTLQLRRLLWAEDGWPLAAEPGLEKGYNKGVPKVTELMGVWKHSVNFGEPASITLLANGRINNPKGENTWALEGDRLVLRWPRDNAPNGVWIDRCYVSAEGTWYVGRNQNGMVIRGIRDRARF